MSPAPAAPPPLPQTPPRTRTRRRSGTSARRRGAAGLLATALAVSVAQLPLSSFGADRTGPAAAASRGWGDSPAGLGDLDTRGTAAPTLTQRRAAAALGATVRWNAFGTPSSIFSPSGSLGSTGGADAVTAARDWVRTHRSLLGLSSSQVEGLELVNNQKLAGSRARAVLLRQRFGQLSPALASMVTVGVADGRIVYVSSSLTRTTGTPAAPVLNAEQAWLTAATNVGERLSLSDITRSVDPVTRGDWTRMRVTGLAQEQLARLRALALADGTVRPVFETNVVDVQGGSAKAYTVMVDAVTGAVLHRENQVEHSSDVQPFNGEITATQCGPRHEFELTDANTRQIAVVASTVNPANDITIKLFGANGEPLSSADLGTSPETLTYAPGGTLPKGVYATQVCPYESPTVPFTAPGTYTAVVTTSDSTGPQAQVPYPPKWAFFTANPSLDFSTDTVPGNRKVGCWEDQVDGARVPGCDLDLVNLAAKAPWDYSFDSQTPTFTTIGNAANTHEAWASPLTPGGLFQAPVSPTREYTPAFTDAWQNSRCNPANLVPGGNDIDASVTQLFASHNRMHDYSYFLGFTEQNYNLQQNNLGANPDPTRENDPEVGNAQAGGVTGASPASSAGTTRTRSRCRTASPASPTSTCSSRSPGRSTRRAPTAATT
ncbi:M36 family metallopeptidase [Nocardioides mesophilus]|uniref:M36 family metallopeptidase n=1 Tax=Nocardioides mesophilus TaxID=433659 RepID=UPI0024842801|nr:M36 family metallopeptidase [Nocardioides mesophilus]